MSDTAWTVVGVAGPDQHAYQALTLRSQATVAELAAELGISRTSTARILGRLADRGLATHLPGKPAQFAAIMPDVVVPALIAAQESQLEGLREHARKLTEASRVTGTRRGPAELVELIEGPARVRAAFLRLQQEAREEIRVCGKRPNAVGQHDGDAGERRLPGRGRVRYRAIYERACLTRQDRMAEIWTGIRNGERVRVAGSVPVRMALSDTRLALILVSADDSRGRDAAYLVHSSSLLVALSELFEAVWGRAVSLNSKPGEASQDVLTAQDRDLLGLLAAGITDETVARALGWSVRTVRRHVRRIMTLTGAQTRFQAGMEASRRGWV